jgi:hypothetical protein
LASRSVSQRSRPTALGERLGHALGARGRKTMENIANVELPEKSR